MTAKEYLRRIRDAERELRTVEREYQRARDDITNLKAMAYDRDKVSSSRIGDLSDAIEALEKYAERVSAKWDALIAFREEAKKQLEQIKDWRYRAVLEQRYLLGESWEQIAKGLGYEYRYTLKLHGWALAAFHKAFLRKTQKDTKRHRKTHSTCAIV